jgi:hypothetical protein
VSLFLQSAGDFPCVVSLGEKAPAWGLSRWAGAGLRFIPPDDEGFTLRGDNRRLVYRGRKRSHRFTILGDTAFEYDCILEREPENNVVTLLMEGVEHFDFFRQPDFVKDPFLAGSYAVYKKETLLGEGTGKLCHIHRPEIIDSRGRRCWGELSIVGNKLCITIPKNWLSEAKYPVIVDPVIGSSGVGAYHSFYYIYDSEYEECLENWQNEGASAAEIAEYLEDWTIMPSAYNELLFNRWISPEPLQGLCKVFFHVAEINYNGYNVFAPVLFNESQNIPNARISSEEYGYLGARDGSPGQQPLGWNMTTFKIQNTVAANSALWLGLTTNGIGISFDYGAVYFDILGSLNSVTAKTNISNGQHLGELLTRIGQYIPDYREAVEYGAGEWIEELRPSVHYQNHNAHPKGAGRYDFKFSYYFQPASIAYTRTLSTGISLTDSRKAAVGYKRTAVQTVGGAGAGDTARRFLSILRKPKQTAGVQSGTGRITQAKRVLADTGGPGAALGRKQDSKRYITHTGNAGAAVLKKAGYVKRFQERAGSTAHTGVVRNMTVRLAEAVAGLYGMRTASCFGRSVRDSAGIGSVMGGMVAFFRTLSGLAGGRDSAGSFVVHMRLIQDMKTLEDETGHTADYLRGLFIEAGNIAEVTHRGEYHRSQQDTAYSEAVSLRHLFIFLRLITGAYIRDYIIGRFLKSREEIIIKSPVRREIILESRVS